MLVDAFQRLGQAGFQVRDYQYTGFGSIYFVDFHLFHKLLGIRNLLSVEHDQSLEDRVKFNCPFDCVNFEIASAADVIPTLSPDRQHILWLDYDYPVTQDLLQEVYLAGSQLSPRSILLITVDVEPPVPGSDDPRESMAYLQSEAGHYLASREVGKFSKGNLPRTSMEIVVNALREGMIGRPDIELHTLFHFLYADGHKMLTVGGVIGGDTERRMLRSLDTNSAFYLRMDLLSDPYEIRVPPLTRKERQFLDSAMPCLPDWQPPEFTIPQDHMNTYREIYRFLPAYGELLV